VGRAVPACSGRFHQYVIDHGRKQGYVVGVDRLRIWLVAPELQNKLKLWKSSPAQPKEPPPKRLSASLKSTVTKANGFNGFQSRGGSDFRCRGEGEPRQPVTLPAMAWLSRSVIPLSESEERAAKGERNGPMDEFDDTTASLPVSVVEGEIVTEGEARALDKLEAAEQALDRIEERDKFEDWLLIGDLIEEAHRECRVRAGSKRTFGGVFNSHMRLWLDGHLRFLRATWWFSVEEQSSVLQMHSRFSGAFSQFACQSHAEANSGACTCRLLDLLVRPCLRQEIEGHLRRERQRANKKDKIPGEHAETRLLLSGEQLEIYFSKINAGQSAISW
jgi:hypothetical protein